MKTRKLLVSSLIMILSCCLLFAGTTFAWFSDEVTSSNNIIEAGNLDVELHYSTDGDNWLPVTEAPLFTSKTWEPGHTEAILLKVTNAGSLALKYSLSLDVTSEVESKTKDGKTITLSKLLEVGTAVNPTELAKVVKDRDAAVELASKNVGFGYICASSVLEKTGVDYVQIAVCMPETVGNEANHAKGEVAPSITFGINLFATQVSNEDDSFDNKYDAGSPWAGAVDATWYNEDDTEFEINTPEQLAGLAKLVNEGTDSFAGKTVSLGNNVDLNNLQWSPISDPNLDDTAVFAGTFDGNGYTISNLNSVNLGSEAWGQGLFGYTANATLKNVNLHNVNVRAYENVGALVGMAYTGNIENVHVTGSVKVVADYAYAGGITSYAYGNIKNCSVIAEGMGEITAKNRNAVGGICGWHLEGETSITNCHVKNLNLTAWTNIGGITGFVHYSNVIDGCSVENVVLTKTRADGHPGIGYIAGGWSYNANKAITLTNNIIMNASLNGTYVAVASANVLYGSEYGGNLNINFLLDNNETLNVQNNLVEVNAAKDTQTLISSLAEGNKTVVLSADLSVNSNETPNTGYGNVGVSISSGVLDGNGKKLTVTGAWDTYGCVVNATGGTIKNITVSSAMRGIFMPGASADLYIENVIFDDVIYTFNSDAGNKAYGVYVSNSKLYGWTSFTNAHSEVIFTDCTFGEGNGYAFCRPYNEETKFINCVFEVGFEFDTSKVSGIVFENCYYGDTLITAENAASLASGANLFFYNGLNGADIR